MNKILLVGAFHEIIELCQREGTEIVGIFDNEKTGEYMGCPIIGKDSDAEFLFADFGKYPIIITPDSPQIRKKINQHYATLGYRCTNLISSSAFVSDSAKIGNGIVIQDNVYVSSNAIIGDGVKLNVASTVMHDSRVGEYSTIAPRALILGYVSVGELNYIGANATILPHVTIDAQVTVGAGAVVTRNVTYNKIIKGVPAK